MCCALVPKFKTFVQGICSKLLCISVCPFGACGRCCLHFVNTLAWLFLDCALPPSKPKVPWTTKGHPFFFLKSTKTHCFKQLCWPAQPLCYPGRLASCSYTPFITYFQWLAPSRLQLQGQVGCRLVDNVWGISNQSSAEARALRPSPPFTPSRGVELQQWPRSMSPARQEVTGKEPWEPASRSVQIWG